jgi:hypothetical protein
VEGAGGERSTPGPKASRHDVEHVLEDSLPDPDVHVLEDEDLRKAR